MTAMSCGLQVVRKPDRNFDAEGRGAFSSVLPKLNDLLYGGFDRMDWFDVHEAYYARDIPDRVNLLRSELASIVEFDIDIEVLRDIGKVHELLKFSNRNGAANEVISLHFEGAPSFELPATLNTEFLGVDIFVSGYGSMVLEGVFARPELFPEVLPHLNTNGLFDDVRGPIDPYIERFAHLTDPSVIEVFPTTLPRHKIAIHRVFLGR